VHGVFDSARPLVRKPFARGGCCLLLSSTRLAPRNSTRFAAQYPAHGLPCERFKLSLAASPCITRGRGGWLDLTPWKTLTSYPLPAKLAHTASGSWSGRARTVPGWSLVPAIADGFDAARKTFRVGRQPPRAASAGEDRPTHAQCIHLPRRCKGPVKLQVHGSSTRNGIYDVQSSAKTRPHHRFWLWCPAAARRAAPACGANLITYLRPRRRRSSNCAHSIAGIGNSVRRITCGTGACTSGT
jgi:hypothetical protein